MAWKLEIADLATGASVGELQQADDRKVRHAFNGRPKTASAKIRLDNPLATILLSGAALLKAYENDTLRFIGPLVTAEEVAAGDGGSIALTFADAWPIVAGRLIGKNAVGYRDGTAGSPKDLTTLVAGVLAAANTSGWTGVSLGSTTNTGITSFVEAAPYKEAGVAVLELVNAYGGPDIELVHQEPIDLGGGQIEIAKLNVKPAIGQARPDAVFEYGTGRKNVASYNRKIDLTSLLNRGYALPPSAAGGSVVTATDAASITAYGLREAVVATDVDVEALRQTLVDEHVRVRKQPRVLISFQPTRDDPATPGRVPQYGVDFLLGDTVPFRAVDEQGIVRVNATLRVYAVDWSIDEQGASVPSFTLTSD